MKLVYAGMITILGFFCSFSLYSQTAMENLTDSASYAVGINFAMAQLKPTIDQAQAQGIEIDVELLVAAIQDVMIEGKPQLTEELSQQVLTRWQIEIQAMLKQENAKKADAFLSENKSKPGVKSTASGMQYIVVKSGSEGGVSPTLSDSVVVKYKGSLLDGTVFDQTPPGETITFVPRGLIKGWQEALQMMKPGDKWKLFLPSGLAYGDRGSPPAIPPGATLIFELELLDVK